MKSDIHFFGFQQEVKSLNKIGQKYKYCFFKVKFGIQTNSNIMNVNSNVCFYIFDLKPGN